VGSSSSTAGLGAGGGVDNDGRDERGQHTSSSIILVIILEHAGTDLDPVSCGQLLEHGGAGSGVDNDGRDKRGQHVSSLIIIVIIIDAPAWSYHQMMFITIGPMKKL